MYGKLFAQMYDGSLGTHGPWEALVTFQQLIVLADQHGVIDISPERISQRTTIPLEIIKKGISALEQPDPFSRSPEHEGRRILLLRPHTDWGWKIVNHEKYRKIRNAEDRKQYHREYYQARKAQAADSTDSTSSQQFNRSIEHGYELESENSDLQNSENSGARDLNADCGKSQLGPDAAEQVPAKQPSHAREGGAKAARTDLAHSDPSHDWTAEKQLAEFVAAYERAQGTYPNLGGKNVGGFHAAVLRTAELQCVLPGNIFREKLAEWLPRMTREARRAPYAFFCQAWGELTARGPVVDGPSPNQPRTAASVRASAKAAFMAGDQTTCDRLMIEVKELEEAESRRGKR